MQATYTTTSLKDWPWLTYAIDSSPYFKIRFRCRLLTHVDFSERLCKRHGNHLNSNKSLGEWVVKITMCVLSPAYGALSWQNCENQSCGWSEWKRSSAASNRTEKEVEQRVALKAGAQKGTAKYQFKVFFCWQLLGCSIVDLISMFRTLVPPHLGSPARRSLLATTAWSWRKKPL